MSTSGSEGSGNWNLVEYVELRAFLMKRVEITMLNRKNWAPWFLSTRTERSRATRLGKLQKD